MHRKLDRIEESMRDANAPLVSAQGTPGPLGYKLPLKVRRLGAGIHYISDAAGHPVATMAYAHGSTDAARDSSMASDETGKAVKALAELIASAPTLLAQRDALAKRCEATELALSKAREYVQQCDRIASACVVLESLGRADVASSLRIFQGALLHSLLSPCADAALAGIEVRT